MATTETIPTVEPWRSEDSEVHHTKKGWKKLLPGKTRTKEGATPKPREPGLGPHEQETEEPVQHDKSRPAPLKKWRWPSSKTSEPSTAPSAGAPPAGAPREAAQVSDVDVASRQDNPAVTSTKDGRRNSKKLVKAKSNKQKAAEAAAATPDAQSPPSTPKPSSSAPGSPISRLVASLKKHPSKPEEQASDVSHESTASADRETTSASAEPPTTPEKGHKLFSGKLSRPTKTTASTPLASVEEDAPVGYRCPACGHYDPGTSPRPKASQRPSSGPPEKESLFKKHRRRSGSG